MLTDEQTRELETALHFNRRLHGIDTGDPPSTLDELRYRVSRLERLVEKLAMIAVGARQG